MSDNQVVHYYITLPHYIFQKGHFFSCDLQAVSNPALRLKEDLGRSVSSYSDAGSTGYREYNEITGSRLDGGGEWVSQTTTPATAGGESNVRWEYFDEEGYVKGDGGVADGEDAYAKNQV